MENNFRLRPTILVIFGAAGDLTWRKLTPALYSLFLDGWLPDQFAVLGLDRSDSSDEAFREHLREGVEKNSRRGDIEGGRWEAFAENLTFQKADFEDDKSYAALAKHLKKI
jgi:glucose-6-phosphate 1-dehydrogenase